MKTWLDKSPHDRSFQFEINLFSALSKPALRHLGIKEFDPATFVDGPTSPPQAYRWHSQSKPWR
jgi:hypothetical protein